MVHVPRKILILVAVLIFLITACSSNHSALQNTSWALQALTAGGEQIQLQIDRLPTLEIGNNSEVGGFAGCNSFGGEIQFKPDGSLLVSTLFQTEMWCEEGMQVETTYLSALAAGAHYKIDDGRLTISSEDGQAELVYVPSEQ